MVASTSPANPLLARLRAETHERHARLDSIVGTAQLTTREAYEQFLIASLLAVSAVEPGVARRLGANFESLRGERLRSDLRALGGPASADHLPALEPYDPPNEAAAWGSAYVLEGSALGGLVLAQRVQAALGSDVPLGYLSLRGTSTPAHWRDFLARLTRFARDASDQAHSQAAGAARLTFDLYLAAFRRGFPQVGS